MLEIKNLSVSVENKEILREGGKVFVTEKAIAGMRTLMKDVLDSLRGTSLVFGGVAQSAPQNEP